MAGDWIKLHRQLLHSAVMRHDGLLRLWIYCLLRANWRDRSVLLPRTTRQVQLTRGQFITGRRALHAALYPDRDQDGQPIAYSAPPPSESTLWRWLLNLADAGQVELQSEQTFTIVTVCNYVTYQNTDEEFEPEDEPTMNNPRTTPEPDVNQRRTSHEPVVNTEEEGKNIKKKKNTSSSHHPGFDEFWSAYPRKVGKKAAVAAFAKLAPDTDLLTRMLAAIAAQRTTPAWLKDGGQFIPHPATWLNGGRWDDELAPSLNGNGHHAEETPDQRRERVIRERREADRLEAERLADTAVSAIPANPDPMEIDF